MSVNTAAGQAAPENVEQIMEIITDVMRTNMRLFGQHVNLRAFVETAKKLAVEEAYRRAEAKRAAENSEKRILVSEISLDTGLDTRVIQRLKPRNEDAAPIPMRMISPEAALLARWARDPMFRDVINNKPKILPIMGKLGTFQGLVVTYLGRGISAPLALKRLAARGAVREVNHNWVELLDPNWRWIEQDEMKFLEAAKNSMKSLGKTLLHNFANRDNEDEKWTERRVFTFHISEEKRLMARRVVNKLLMEQRFAMFELLQSLDEGSSGKAFVVGAGYYYWEDDGMA